MNSIVKMTTGAARFTIEPALRTIARRKTLWFAKLFGSLSGSAPAVELRPSSPSRRTNPPRGIQLMV